MGELPIEKKVVSTLVIYDDDYFAQWWAIEDEPGGILALPFINTEKVLEGYLLYHDQHRRAYHKDELSKLLLSVMTSQTPCATVNGLKHLPLKPIADDGGMEVEDAVLSIIIKNTHTCLTKNSLII